MLKKIFIFALLLISCIAAGFAQQNMITRIAVVDFTRVYNTFNQQSRALRDLQTLNTRIQTDIDRMQNEIRALEVRRVEALQRNDQSAVTNLIREMTTKAEELRVYNLSATMELEEARRNINMSSFMQSIQSELRLLAEAEGITAFFDLNQLQGLIWHSPAIDYTDRLITRLRPRFN